MANGSCMCGNISYETAEIGPSVTKCHCKLCQKSSGSAYGDYTISPIDSFKWTQGEQLLARYESSPGVFRSFCPTCGTHMPSAHPPMGIVFIHPGTLDSDEQLVESTHMFLRSKATWHEQRKGLKEYAEYPT